MRSFVRGLYEDCYDRAGRCRREAGYGHPPALGSVGTKRSPHDLAEHCARLKWSCDFPEVGRLVGAHARKFGRDVVKRIDVFDEQVMQRRQVLGSLAVASEQRDSVCAIVGLCEEVVDHAQARLHGCQVLRRFGEGVVDVPDFDIDPLDIALKSFQRISIAHE